MIVKMNTSLHCERENFLKGFGDVDTALRLLKVIMNKSTKTSFKVILNDDRILYGSLMYMDRRVILLTQSVEHYYGVIHFVRDCGDILIPLNFIKSIHIERKHFYNCYKKLKRMNT